MHMEIADLITYINSGIFCSANTIFIPEIFFLNRKFTVHLETE